MVRTFLCARIKMQLSSGKTLFLCHSCNLLFLLFDRKGTICIGRNCWLGDQEWGQQRLCLFWFWPVSGFMHFKEEGWNLWYCGILTDKQKTRNLGLNCSLAYFSALNSVARFRINRSYFEHSPREISGPWTSWRETSLSQRFLQKPSLVESQTCSLPGLGRRASLWLSFFSC